MGEAKRRREAEPAELRYWIAAYRDNIGSLSPIPLRDPVVSPTPDLLIGYPTREEAQALLQRTLTAPSSTGAAYCEHLFPEVEGDRLVVINPSHPEPWDPGGIITWTEREPLGRVTADEARHAPPNTRVVAFGHELKAAFRATGVPVPNAELDVIVHRHLAASTRADRADRNTCTHTRVRLRSGRWIRIITETRPEPGPDGALLTVCGLAEEWTTLTGTPHHHHGSPRDN